MKKTFSAPQKFRVIDTEDGRVEIQQLFVMPQKGVLHDVDGIEEWEPTSGRCIIIPSNDRYIASASIGMTDSKGVEIFSGDVVTDEINGIMIVAYNIEESCYLYHDIRRRESYHYTNEISSPVIVGNIWQPSYKKYLDRLKSDNESK